MAFDQNNGTFSVKWEFKRLFLAVPAIVPFKQRKETFFCNMFTIIVFTFVYTLLIGCIDKMMVDRLGKEEWEGGQRIPLLAKKLTKLCIGVISMKKMQQNLSYNFFVFSPKQRRERCQEIGVKSYVLCRSS